MEENNVKRVHEKLLKTNLVNGYGISVFMVFVVFFPSEQTCAILSFLDGTLRFAESVMVLHICAGAGSQKQCVQVALRKALHTNATVLGLCSCRPY